MEGLEIWDLCPLILDEEGREDLGAEKPGLAGAIKSLAAHWQVNCLN